MREIVEFESVKKAMLHLSNESKKSYRTTLKQYLQFRNNKEGLTSEVNPDILIEEAKENIDFTQRQINNFYMWLQGKKIEGHSQGFKISNSGKILPIKVKRSSARARAYGYLRGFYANNNIAFERTWKKRIPKQQFNKESIKKDEIYVFFKIDEKKKEIYFNRELMRQFLSNLKLRDQAITLALLSSAQDTGDLFKLNIGKITEQNMSNRIYWNSTRNKTGVLFKTFFSKEAKKLIMRYITQERRDAKDEEPLFVTARGKRMKPDHISSIYRDAAKKMGVKWGEGEQNPLRPKRMRHLFRTACDTVGIPELYSNMFMGHKNSIGMNYSEVSRAKAELEYLRVEPFLTVYSEVEETTGMKEEVSKQGTTIDTLTKRNVEINKRLDYFVNSSAEKEAERKVKDEETAKEIKELKQKTTKKIAKNMKKIKELTKELFQANQKIVNIERENRNWKISFEYLDNIIQDLVSEKRKSTVEE